MKAPGTAIPLSIFTAVFVLLCFTYYPEQLFMAPYGFHEWAQTDRLALAMKFYDNGMNFFRPATYNLASIDGVVGVEFPIQSYLAAALGHVFGRENISVCFRLVTLAFSYAGLAALFLFCYRHTRDTVASLFVPVFLFCSPIFIYYSCSYLPDAAAVSMCFVGYYFFDRFVYEGRGRQLVAAIIALTLATLIKTSTGTYLVAAMIVAVLWPGARKNIGSMGRVLTMYAASIAVIVGYYFYNQHLNKTYHSDLFLARPFPFQPGEFEYYINDRFRNVWMKEYFVLPQYLLLFGVPAAGIPFLMKRSWGKTMLATISVTLIGVLAMAVLFGHQFIDHDYYVVSIFFPLFALLLTVCVIAIRQRVDVTTDVRSLRLFAVTTMLVTFVFADYHYYRRVHMDERQYPSWKNGLGSTWMTGADKELDMLGVKQTEPIAAVGEWATNLTFVYLDRNGYVFDHHIAAHLVSFMEERGLRVAVAKTEVMEEVAEQNPDVMTHFNVVKREKMWVLLKK